MTNVAKAMSLAVTSLGNDWIAYAVLGATLLTYRSVPLHPSRYLGMAALVIGWRTHLLIQDGLRTLHASRPSESSVRERA